MSAPFENKVHGCILAFYMTYACPAQIRNQITSLDGAVFPSGLTKLWLVSFMIADFVQWCLCAMCDARAAWILRDCPCCDAAYLTSACHSQCGNQITSLDGAVFPTGLTELALVSFHV